MKATAFILTMLLSAVVSAQEKPTIGCAPVNGLKMYYEVHGNGDPVVLLHGSFMTRHRPDGERLSRRQAVKQDKSPMHRDNLRNCQLAKASEQSSNPLACSDV